MKIFLLAFVLSIAAAPSLAQCPSITVIGPAGVTNAGDKMTFRVEVGVIGPKLEYYWSINWGTIVEGQGTPVITIVTDPGMNGDSVTATVDVSGLPSPCRRTALATVPVVRIPQWCWDLDAYGSIKPNEERVRLDSFFAELMNNPSYIGFILLRITEKERRDPGNRRIQFILRHSKFRKFDQGRLLFALELADEQRTIPVRINPGGEMPPCDSCLIIKGADF